MALVDLDPQRSLVEWWERRGQTDNPVIMDGVAISHNEDWYDVQSMTARELEDFVGDLLRAEAAALQTGRTDPH